jgi:hypothetical protein
MRTLAAVSALVLGVALPDGAALAQLPASDSLNSHRQVSPAPELAIPAARPRGPGLSLTVGGGAANRRIYCDGCSQGTGFAALVNLSHPLTPTMAVGVEGTGWFKHAGSVTANLWSAMAVATFWLEDQAPLFLQGGLGLVTYHESDASWTSSSGGTALGCSGRIGYEAGLSPSFAVVPYVGYVSSIGRLTVGRLQQPVSTLQFGLALRVR